MPSDFDLLDRWAAGDREAAAALIDRHFQTLYRFFRVQAPRDAEDLVQQTLLACVEGRERFRRASSFRTYVLRTARFQLYARNRRRRAEAPQGASGQTHAGVPALGTSPTGVLARADDRRVLLEALRRLPLDHQLVLELHLWESLTGPELAEALDIPEPAVRSRLRRALERLRMEALALVAAPIKLRDTVDTLDRWAVRLSAASGRIRSAP
jgi:RNA polymerase sigma-70 factor (ECF subfamily)